jgi:hypothetical protein
VSAYIESVEKTQFFGDSSVLESFAYQLAWYRPRVSASRLKFRIGGVLVLVFSAAIPFVAAFGGTMPGVPPIAKDVAVAAMATLISLAAGLNTFFRWDTQWREQTTSIFRLQQLRANWELAKVDALSGADPAKAIEEVRSAARAFVADTYAVSGGEMAVYFQGMSFPEIKKQ